jgi:hypothetical protein
MNEAMTIHYATLLRIGQMMTEIQHKQKNTVILFRSNHFRGYRIEKGFYLMAGHKRTIHKNLEIHVKFLWI